MAMFTSLTRDLITTLLIMVLMAMTFMTTASIVTSFATVGALGVGLIVTSWGGVY